MLAVYAEIHAKHIGLNTLSVQNIEFLDVKPDGTYSSYWIVKSLYYQAIVDLVNVCFCHVDCWYSGILVRFLRTHVSHNVQCELRKRRSGNWHSDSTPFLHLQRCVQRVSLWVLHECLCGYFTSVFVRTSRVSLWVLYECLCGYFTSVFVRTSRASLWVLYECLCGYFMISRKFLKTEKLRVLWRVMSSVSNLLTVPVWSYTTSANLDHNTRRQMP